MLLYGLAQDVRNRFTVILEKLCERWRCGLIVGMLTSLNLLKTAVL